MAIVVACLCSCFFFFSIFLNQLFFTLINVVSLFVFCSELVPLMVNSVFLLSIILSFCFCNFLLFCFLQFITYVQKYILLLLIFFLICLCRAPVNLSRLQAAAAGAQRPGSDVAPLHGRSGEPAGH